MRPTPRFTHLHPIHSVATTLYCSPKHRAAPELCVFTRAQKSSCAGYLSPFINNRSEPRRHLQAASLSCRVFIRRTIDTKFPPIPVVPHCFQLQEFEGGGEIERGEVQKGGVGGQRGEEDRTISTGKRRALVHSLLAVESGVAAGTLAHVAAAIVLLPALAAVEAGRVGARQQAVLAVGALETLGARAHVAAFQILGGK